METATATETEPEKLSRDWKWLLIRNHTQSCALFSYCFTAGLDDFNVCACGMRVNSMCVCMRLYDRTNEQLQLI